MCTKIKCVVFFVLHIQYHIQLLVFKCSYYYIQIFLLLKYTLCIFKFWDSNSLASGKHCTLLSVCGWTPSINNVNVKCASSCPIIVLHSVGSKHSSIHLVQYSLVWDVEMETGLCEDVDFSLWFYVDWPDLVPFHPFHFPVTALTRSSFKSRVDLNPGCFSSPLKAVVFGYITLKVTCYVTAL